MKAMRFFANGGISFLLITCLTLLTACQTASPPPGDPKDLSGKTGELMPRSAEDLIIVDCLLPGQVRKLGSMTYLTPRRPTKSTAIDCEIRGGEYVAFDRSNYSTALNVWLGKAEEGDATAQNYVGEIYQKGLGLEPQYDLAAEWFRKAADQGNYRAQMNLGYLYERGLGVEENSVEAINWYRKATGLDEALTLFGRQKQEELETLRQESERNRLEIGNLRKQLEKAQKEMTRRQQQVKSRNKALEREREKLGQARRDLEEKKKQFASTDWNQLETLARQLARQKVNLGSQHVVAARLHDDIQSLSQRKKALTESYQRQLLKMNAELAVHASELDRQKKESERLKNEIHALEMQKHEVSGTDPGKLDRLTQTLEQQRLVLDRQSLKANRLRSEIKSLKAEKQKLIAVRQERESQVVQDMNQREAQLEQQRKRVEALKKEIALLEQKKVRLSNDNIADLARLEDELSFREMDLESKSKETAELKQKVRQLGKEADSYRLELEKLQKKLAGLPGPTIEMIDPILLATRGIKVAPITRSVTKRHVIGKVTSAVGVQQVFVNEIQQSLEKKGLFQTWIPLEPSGPTEVLIRAVDLQGKDSKLRFTIAASRGMPNKAVSKFKAPAYNFGNYYALVIGNNDYRKLPKLKSPANDANEISRILKQKYGFQVKTMLNASRFEIYTMLDKYRRELTEKDNFLIYYAGHGELDSANNRGYWLPIDAEPESNVNSIPNFTITDILNNMQAKQAIIVADTCYSGILTRSIVPVPKQNLTVEKRNQWLHKMSKSRSRTVLSSGGLEPILDVGYGKHSVFARAFIEVLESNDDILEASQLHRKLIAIVTSISKKLGLEQSPLYAANPHAGHKSGDFLFVPKEYQTQWRADLTWNQN